MSVCISWVSACNNNRLVALVPSQASQGHRVRATRMLLGYVPAEFRPFMNELLRSKVRSAEPLRIRTGLAEQVHSAWDIFYTSNSACERYLFAHTCALPGISGVNLFGVQSVLKRSPEPLNR